MSFEYKELKSRQRDIRDGLPANLNLRVHRSLSWLHRAEMEESDNDAEFVFLWVAFNAAYAQDIHDRYKFSEQRIFLNFLQKLIDLDKEKLLYQLVWKTFSGSIRTLINNQYVFEPFWSFQNNRISEQEWEDKFLLSKSSANKALGRMNTKKVLAIIFDRLYVLRNQLIHGGATWNGGVNREQVRDGVNIMKMVVPIIIHLMLESKGELWGEARYPVIK